MKNRYKIAYALEMDGPWAELVRTEHGRHGQSRTVWRALMPPSAADRQALNSILLAAAGEHPVFSVPVCISDSVFRRLSTPFPSVRKARKVFPSLLNIQLPFDLAQCQYALLTPHAENGQAHALAIAIRNETLQRILEQCAAIGIDPQVVQHEGIALWQEISGALPPVPGARRVTAFLGRHRTILLYGEGAVPLGAQQLAIGLESLSMSRPEEQASWASKALLFIRAHWKNPQEPLVWIWCGVGTEQAETIAQLERQLAMPESVAYRSLVISDAPVAQALNHMALTEPPVFHNFRHGAFAHPQTAQQLACIKRNTMLWLYALGIILCATGIGWKAMLQRQNRILDRYLDETVCEITGGVHAPKAQEVAFVSRILEERRASQCAFSDLLNRPVEGLLSRLLALSDENRIQIQRLVLHADDVEIKGCANRWEAGTLLESELQNNGYKTDIQRQDAGADEMVHFVLKGIRREKT